MTKNERDHAKKHLYKQPGSGNWFARFYLHGKQIRETTGTADETEACRIVLNRLDELGAHRAGIKKFVGPEQKKITVNDLLDALKVRFTAQGRNTPRFLSNLRPMAEWFGDYRAVELTSTDIDKFIIHAQQHGRRKNPTKPLGVHGGRPCSTRPAKASSINRSLQLLGQAYKLAIRNGRLTSAPRIERQSEIGNARQGFFSNMELRSVVSNLPEYLQDYVLFAYLTGWRAGECKSLSWTELDGDVLKLRAENSKNGTSRAVPLVGELQELVNRRRLQMSSKTSLIFHNNGLRIGDFRRTWRTACQLAGCPGRLFHDLRRSAVRDMVRAGTPESVAMSISGHKTRAMFSRYNISSDKDQRQAMLDRQNYNAKQETTGTSNPEEMPTAQPVTDVIQ